MDELNASNVLFSKERFNQIEQSYIQNAKDLSKLITIAENHGFIRKNGFYNDTPKVWDEIIKLEKIMKKQDQWFIEYQNYLDTRSL